jgi:DNA-3-methyladenine glycosylase II
MLSTDFSERSPVPRGSPPSLFDPSERRRGLLRLRRADPVLAHEIRRQGDIWPPRKVSYFALLCHIIIDQQISVAAGRTIFERWAASLGGTPSPQAARSQSADRARACGLSAAKARSIRAVAEAECGGELRLRGLSRLDDDSVRERLLAIHGLGPWSAEMFLLFGLGRPDIFSTGDLGLRRAMQELLRREGLDPDAVGTENAWLERASTWRPYRSLASVYLWRLLDEG